MKVPLASSGLRESDIVEVVRVLRSGNLTMGAEVKKFEHKMAMYLGAEHFVMMNSGSSANLLMIEALLRPAIKRPTLNAGDSILVPAIAWPTTIWPLIQLGLNPIFVDIDERTLAMDLRKAQVLIDETGIPIKGLFPIHPLGHAMSPSELSSFASRNELVLINDVCESLGSWREGIHAGMEGIASSFSFYFSHHITTMEGGGVATNDAQYADDLRSMRSHGWSRDRSDVEHWNVNKTTNDAKFLFVSTGYNVRPLEIEAVIGSGQIDQITRFVEKRQNIAERVVRALEGTKMEVIGGNSLVQDRKSNSWMLIPILVQGKNSNQDKIKIVERLTALGIETRPVLTGNFLAQPAIQRITRHSADPEKFTSATKITNSAFLVGAHHDLTEDQIEYLCKSLNSVGAEI